ncbi:hypothetical protein [Streptomyces erythrochromogenes]|uniref:hypothetical protein n=1 Tax=Streptomyces erythrochromogenes TaxID=285574 RepID=UPI003422AB15
MSGTTASDDGVPAGALTAALNSFAEAAGALLATPSQCREVLLGALGRCWEELHPVGRHLRPYAHDPAGVYDRFESARASLERLLWAADRAGAAEPGAVGAGPADRVEAPSAAPAGTLRPHDGAGTGAMPDPAPDTDTDTAAGAADGPERESGGAPPGTAAGTGPQHPATGGYGGGVAPPARSAPPADPLAGFEAALAALEGRLRTEQSGYLPRTPASAAIRPPAGSAERIAATWQRLHMALLRLPAHLREEWRVEALETAGAAGLAVTAEDASDPDVIVPGLPRGLRAAERIPLVVAAPRSAATGVREEIHLKLGTSPGTVMDLPSTDPRPMWAVRAEQALRLVDLDPELHVAVLVEDPPSSLATEEARLGYRLRLDSLLESAGSSQADDWPADSRLAAAHELDMVLGGLVHKRPAATDSWWWQWRTGVSEVLAPLAESAGYRLVSKDVSRWTMYDIDAYTVKNSVPGQSGEPLVQWVLWTPLQRKGGSAGNERKGRIVMRPQQQYGPQASP